MRHASAYRFVDPAALARVKNLALVARGVVEGFITGLHASPYKGFSVEFAEHRKYSPGDNPRHLDWRILGRTDRLYVKQYEEETNLRAQVLLDSSASMAYRFGDGLTKLEYGCYLAASLVAATMRRDLLGPVRRDFSILLDACGNDLDRAIAESGRRLDYTMLEHARDLAGALRWNAAGLLRPVRAAGPAEPVTSDPRSR